jgi:hypothetical protein
LPAFKDLSGQRIGYWTVLHRLPNEGRKVRWLCRCICGTEKPVLANSLIVAQSRSCGCKKGELLRPNLLPEVDRFWGRVEKADGCWLWNGSIHRSGYGLFAPRHHVQEWAHRYAYKITHGEIAPGLFVCHACDNPRCVRPEHLWLGSHQQNVTDMVQKGRAKDWSGLPSRKKGRITPEIVREMRRRWEEERTPFHKLGEEYGISRTQASNIVHGRSWGWVV